MLSEEATVVSIEPDGLWVETLSTSACAKCHAQAGCGQKILSGYTAQSTQVKAYYPTSYSSEVWLVGDKVNIGIHEQALVRSALQVYLLPLLLMVCFVLFAHILDMSEPLIACMGVSGLLFGGVVSSKISAINSTSLSDLNNKSCVYPIILGRV